MSEPTIRKAVNVLEFLSQDAEARRLYEMREKALKDELNMVEGAKEEGRTEGKAVIVRNMLAKGLNVAEISELTGLTIAEVEKLKQQLH